MSTDDTPRCIIEQGGELERQLASHIDAGTIDVDVADTIRRFGEWLEKAGSPPPMVPTGPHSEAAAWEYEHRYQAWQRTRTPEQRRFVRDCLRDPEWRAFLGFDPLPDTGEELTRG